ncbi:hypothetical protein FJT64_014508 [Amphibalanus amphitrite]|uniref:Uncharacterized protein n=1 Tax=Amphibalanus amphitrite TaxID=1232801 RepID=A0A6A4V780_AMPAM|nr:hypothetical protein FJT64_014508 [Amphibalanus amphitrite]
MSWLLRNVTTLALCLPLLLLVLAHCCRASDPFAMFEFELTPEGGKDCCAEADRCHRLLDALGPLRARWATRARPPSRHQLNSAFMQRHVKRTLKLLRIHEDVQPAERETFQLRGRISEVQVLRLRQFLAGSDHISLVETDAILEDIFADSEFESLLTEGQPRWLRQLRQLIPDVSTELIPLLLTILLGSWLLVALLFGKSWTFVKTEDKCREYYMRLHVDPFSEVSPVSRDDSEALHVTVEPGQERVYLVVTASGEVQPVGAESRRRTVVQRAGPERVGWLAWTGRGLYPTETTARPASSHILTVNHVTV